MNQNKQTGKFIISLDFELFWGVRDKRTLGNYGSAIANVHEVVPRLLELFDAYQVRATFATVGFLFAKNKQQIQAYSPKLKPGYKDSNLSPYHDFDGVGEDSKRDLYHYAPDLIEIILQSGKHEIASHTFSHYYCLEEGQTIMEFREDMKSAIAIAKEHGVEIKSLVFPRNQFKEDYLKVLGELGITSYRGNESIWFHRNESEVDTTLLKRIFRTLNCYVNLSGHHCYELGSLAGESTVYNIPSSRFLRPYSAKLQFLEGLKLNRIKKSMTYTAKNGLAYHIWWHPHNFGTNMEENFTMLEKILKIYANLNERYGYQSCTMAEMTNLLKTIN